MVTKLLIDAGAIALGASDILARAAAISAQKVARSSASREKRGRKPGPSASQSIRADEDVSQPPPSWASRPPEDALRPALQSKSKGREPYQSWPKTYQTDLSKAQHLSAGDSAAHTSPAFRIGRRDTLDRPVARDAAADFPSTRTSPTELAAGGTPGASNSASVDSMWLGDAPASRSKRAPSYPQTESLEPLRPARPSSSRPVQASASPTPDSSEASTDPEDPQRSTRDHVRERFVLNEELSGNQPSTSAPALRASKIPSSRIGRLFHYGGLATGLGWGVASEAVRRGIGGGGTADEGPTGQARTSLLLSEANVRRLVDKLSRMRGAALKLGQFMSIQDAKVLPPQVEEIFNRVQNAADYMPFWQTQQVLAAELGADWRYRFDEFSDIPMAAASIGQVHSAKVRDGNRVAVKIQFPGVYQSISSDLSYISVLVSSSAVLPKGLFLENTMKVLGQELRDECNYKREAWCGRAMGALLEGDPTFRVPKIFDNLSTGMVLTAEFMEGTPLTKAAKWPQGLKDQIGYDILKLCLREILHFRLMQTDPNWTNFLWNWESQQIELIDFGATREYSEDFVAAYLALLQAAIADDEGECVRLSRDLGYFTGDENEMMIKAHVDSLRALAEPFRRRPDGRAYPFVSQTITDRVRAQVPLMLRHRLTPPPRETYSLNRKLSGAFLLLSRLGSEVDCERLLREVVQERSRWMGEDGERARRLRVIEGSHPPDAGAA